MFVDLEVKPTLNTWHQIAITRAGNTWTLYLDGICQSTQDSPGLIAAGNGNINIGILGRDGKDSYFNGLLDDVYIFDEALGASRIYQLYLRGNEVGLEKFSDVVEKAETMLKEQKSKEAITYLEKQISEYEKWKEQAPNTIGLKYEPLYCDLYFLLGKAKKAADISQADVVGAYAKTFNLSRFDYITEQTSALIWLLENDCNDKYKKTIELLTRADKVEEVFAKVIRKVCEHFESKKDWDTFERFLDGLFTSASNPDSWSLFLETCLSDKTSLWAKKYFSYLDKMPRLNIERKWKSTQRYMAEENFEKAAEICRDILNSCGPEDDKVRFEFWLYVCIFEQGKYKEVIPFFESFAINHKATHRILARRAILVKGQAQIQLGEYDKAIETFLGLMTEYPQTKENSEASFFVGYCYMLQKKYEAAKKAFDCVIKDFPESLYAGKARLCLIRIADLTEQEKS